ncbi:MAG: hypothetical protein JWR70_639 [Modestobacter sp.]|nr:hypothetical protein [Modestobacter sp.]
MHGMWGSFWLAYGVMYLLVALGMPTVPTVPTGAFVANRGVRGPWVLVHRPGRDHLGRVAAIPNESVALTAVLTLLAAGSTFAAIGFTAGVSWAETVAGWLFVGLPSSPGTWRAP